MFSRVLARATKTTFAVKKTVPMVRYMGHAAAAPSGDVVIPELVDTLEWMTETPPNVHQFDEPPIIVEIEHLKNVKVPEHH